MIERRQQNDDFFSGFFSSFFLEESCHFHPHSLLCARMAETRVDLRHRRAAKRPMHLLPCTVHAVCCMGGPGRSGPAGRRWKWRRSQAHTSALWPLSGSSAAAATSCRHLAPPPSITYPSSSSQWPGLHRVWAGRCLMSSSRATAAGRYFSLLFKLVALAHCLLKTSLIFPLLLPHWVLHLCHYHPRVLAYVLVFGMHRPFRFFFLGDPKKILLSHFNAPACHMPLIFPPGCPIASRFKTLSVHCWLPLCCTVAQRHCPLCDLNTGR